MSARRFTDKPELDPGAVWSLPRGHPAMVENRTLFPSTVIEVTKDVPERLLVSGANNRKLGATVEKGKFKGYALYGLSLEERATCPGDCSVRGYCYGNGMQMARRHRIGDADVFFDRLGMEICELLDEHHGLLIRLHVLGDFPSVEYVAFWKEVLDEHPKVAIYGYTHRTDKDEIGQAIASVKLAHPERFRIRWSSDTKQPDGAIVLDHIPPAKIKGALVCPAQTDATACCATCGFCWEYASRKDAVAFIKHGRPSIGLVAEKVNGTVDLKGTRAVQAAALLPKPKISSVSPELPRLKLVAPTNLHVETAYQRDLSTKSMRLIRKIVSEWDWAKFKPPICTEAADGLFVIDGQHTAIAAATHPGIKQIPVIIVSAPVVEKRADSFVAHNRDRLAMSPLQVFHAEVTAKDPTAVAILKVAVAVGVSFPRSVPAKGYAKPGQCVSVTAARRIFKVGGGGVLRQVLNIAALSKAAPIGTTLLYGLDVIVRDPLFASLSSKSDEEIAAAVASIANLERAANTYAVESGRNRFSSCAVLIAKAAGWKTKVAA